ncbi:MAG: hypothetical protein FWH43_04750 [Endomicrobia bacterium]|nr:hypothetical protein [Endomicrobiia bacterium]
MKKIFKEIIQFIKDKPSAIRNIAVFAVLIGAFIFACMTTNLLEAIYFLIIFVFIWAVLYYFGKKNIDRSITLLALLMAVVSPLFVQKMEMKKYQTVFLIEKKIKAYEFIDKELINLDEDSRDFVKNLKQIVENCYDKSKENKTTELFKKNADIWNDKISKFLNKTDMHRIYSSLAVKNKILALVEKQLKLAEYHMYLNDAAAKHGEIDKEDEMKKIDSIYLEIHETAREICSQIEQEITDMLGYNTFSETLQSKSIVL